MAACLSGLDKGPVVLAPGVKMATYTFVGGATGWLAVGHQVDCSGEFSEIFGAIACGTDAVADNVYNYSMTFPKDTTITSSNVLLGLFYSTGAGGAMTVVPDAANLSAVGQLQITVWGK